MKMSKVGNQTNSNDPQAVNSRLFVGNLNTYQVTKDDVERMFKRYGRIAGISMHKGYAFVQFTNPYDARNAVQGEDSAVVCGQTLDVNMVAEPKAHQTGRKRQNIGNTGNDWDYYYDSYTMGPQRMTPPMKRARIGGMGGQQRPKGKTGKPNSNNKQLTPVPCAQITTNSGADSSDILICGSCKESFNSLNKLVEHKKTKCKLRFACKCQKQNNSIQKSAGEPASFLCAVCKEKFVHCWDLVSHVQGVHHVAIFEVPADELKNYNEKKDNEEMMSESNNLEGHLDGNGDENDQDVDNIDEEALLQDDEVVGENSQDS